MAVADVQTRFNSTLRELGWPEHAIQGVGMNANDESSWNPTIGGDNGQAYGLLQWNGPRKRALFAFAAANGMDPGDPVLQARFLHHEGQTSEKASVAETWAARSPGEAGAVFVEKFERPAKEHLVRRKSTYLGGGGISGGEGSDTATGGTEGDTLGWAMGEQDRDLPPFEDAPRTWRDRLRTGLVGGGEMLTALGAGHGTNFAATDRFLAGEDERRRLRGGQARADASVNQTVAWLDRLGPEFADLADLARSGDAKSATDAALKRKAEMDKAAAEGGPTGIPGEVVPKLYETGQGLGTAYRGLTSLQGLMDQMDAAIEDGDMDRFRALKEAAQSVEKDFTVGMGRYYSGGTEPSEAYFKDSGIGIPTTLISEQEMDEVLRDYGGDVSGLSIALARKLGGNITDSEDPILKQVLSVLEMVGIERIGGGAAGGGNGLSAKEFNKLRLDQARIRLANAGTRLQSEMTTRQNEYTQATGGNFGTAFGEGWQEQRWGVKEGLDPSDPANWS